MNLLELSVKEIEDQILAKMPRDLALLLEERCNRIINADANDLLAVDSPRELGRLQGSSLRMKWVLQLIKPLL